MDSFEYRDNRLHCENVLLSKVAEEFGTPTYVYSRDAIELAYLAYANALQGRDDMVCFAIKANSNLAVLNILARLGAGFDVVSQGELQRVLKSGGSADRVVFSGVSKQSSEIRYALKAGIHCFNIESAAELERINTVAGQLAMVAPISFRVNPNVDAGTHPYISTGLKENKFGIAIEDAPRLYQHAASLRHVNIIGMDCHIGSQLTEIAPFMDAMDKLLALIDVLDTQGISIKHLDLGGGLGVCYTDEVPPTPQQYIDAVLDKIGDREIKLIFEPGRSIVANAGVLLTEVEYLKHNESKNFAIVDAAMNDMLRPALYSAYLDILPLQISDSQECQEYDVVGPVCETGDFLGKDRQLNIAAGDLLAVCSAGAYGFTMSSNYNTRTRAAEVMVDDNQSYQIRARETFDDLIKGEKILPQN
ncbi:diaminopimelate decarboxylase ['Osedax' symbiont bacterium Rs2_46_30_T18]|nr:diaminopimelate decarboxylase ['Osedax' symbiont bacterium Rs2_46_30_T18]